MKKVALYCRVSTTNQAKAETIDSQLNELKNAYKGRNVVGIYKEQISGSEYSRPELDKLRADAKKGLFDVVGVYHIDRLSRSVAFYYLMKDEFKKSGITLEVLGKPITDNFEDIIKGGIDALFAEATKIRIVEGMMAGKRAKLDAGKILGCYPPYGFNLIKRNREKGTEARFEINPVESLIVKKMFNIYLEENSIRQTSLRLQEMGVLGKKTKKPIDTTTIQRMLRNEVYVGRWYYGKTSACEAKYHIKEKRKHRLSGRVINPREQWKMVKIPAIVNEVIFDRVQDLLKKKKNHYLKPTKYKYLCQGIIKCSHCGRTYFGKRKAASKIRKGSGADYAIYVCPQKYGRKLGESRCRSRTMSVRKLDEKIWSSVVSDMKDSERLKGNIRYLYEQNASKEKEHRNLFNVLMKEKENLKENKRKLLNLYLSESFMKEELEERKQELMSREKILNEELAKAQEKLDQVDYNKDIEKEVELICNHYKKHIDTADFDERKRIVRRVVKDITLLDSGALVVNGFIPNAPYVITTKNEVIEVGENRGAGNTPYLENPSFYPIEFRYVIPYNEVKRELAYA